MYLPTVFSVFTLNLAIPSCPFFVCFYLTKSVPSYKHALDGIYRVVRYEGPTKAFGGATMASTRAISVTVGQLACYDQLKGVLLATGFFGDNMNLHLTASVMAVST